MQSTTSTSTFSINPDSRTYFSAGSSIGWDYAESLRVGVLKWLGAEVKSVEVGTPYAFLAYKEAMALGRQHHSDTGSRCDLELIPELNRWIGWRVEVKSADGSKRRFNVGRSTGWLPCNLEIHNARSRGGGAAYLAPGDVVVPVRRVQ